VRKLAAAATSCVHLKSLNVSGLENQILIFFAQDFSCS
jgi:hypothetical protein